MPSSEPLKTNVNTKSWNTIAITLVFCTVLFSKPSDVRLQCGFIVGVGGRQHRWKTLGPHQSVAASRVVRPWTRPGTGHTHRKRTCLLQRHRHWRHLSNGSRRMGRCRTYRATTSCRRSTNDLFRLDTTRQRMPPFLTIFDLVMALTFDFWPCDVKI